jgi:hypothetical protein
MRHLIYIRIFWKTDFPSFPDDNYKHCRGHTKSAPEYRNVYYRFVLQIVFRTIKKPLTGRIPRHLCCEEFQLFTDLSQNEVVNSE